MQQEVLLVDDDGKGMPMSAAQRKAVGQRLKAYWTARKAKKAG
jgi:hypothetical protein